MRSPAKLARRSSISALPIRRRPMPHSPSGERRRLLVDGRHRDRSRKMRETVIVEAVRTPVGKRNGGLSSMPAADLSALVLNELLQRTGICPEIIDGAVG